MSSKVFDIGKDAIPYAWMPVAADSVPPAGFSSGEPSLFLPAPALAPPLASSDSSPEPHAGGASAELEGELRNCRARILQLEQEAAQTQARIPEERRSAYQEGVDRGEENASAKWSDAMLRVTKALVDLAQHKPRLRREVEHDAVRLSLAIARKVLHRELAVDPEAIAGLVRVAFEKVNTRDVLRVRVAAADVPFLSAKYAGFAIPERIEIMPDPALERGSVLLDLNQGQIDASASTQLDEIERGLTDALDRSGN